MADTRLNALDAEFGDLLEARAAPRGVTDLSRWRDDIVGFARDFLGVKTLWLKQEEALRGIAEHRRFIHFGANSTGKTFLDAIAIIWLVFVRDTRVLALGPKEDQLKNQLMLNIRQLWHDAPDLPGEVYSMGLKRTDHPFAELLCRATGDPHRVRGYHAPNFAIAISEGQGVDEWVWEVCERMATGAEHKIIASGNTDAGPQGPFWKATRLWPHVQLSALDHPNVVTGTEVIPGGPSQEWVDGMAADHGVDSPFYITAVLGAFARDVMQGLIMPAWIDTACAFWEANLFTAWLPRSQLSLGIDVARHGSNKTVVAAARRDTNIAVVQEFTAWQGCDLTETERRVIEVCDRYGIRPRVNPSYAMENALLRAGPWGEALVNAPIGDPLRYEGHARKARLVWDIVGVGGGPHDTLKNRRYPCVGVNGGAKAIGPKADRFFNRRAEMAWTLRELLEAGHAWDQRRRAGEPPGRPVGLALPPADRDQLLRELCAIEWTITGDRKIQLEGKNTIGPKLGKGQSPDYFDALCLSLTHDYVRDFSGMGEPAVL
jgi:hypothetical protein